MLIIVCFNLVLLATPEISNSGVEEDAPTQTPAVEENDKDDSLLDQLRQDIQKKEHTLEDSQDDQQHVFGLVLESSFTSANAQDVPMPGGGLGFRLGVERYGLQVTGGGIPIVINTINTESFSEKSASTQVFYTGYVRGGFYFLPWTIGKRAMFGGMAGYQYNGLLGHGGAATGIFEVRHLTNLSWRFGVDFSYFPDGKAQMDAKKSLPELTKDEKRFPNESVQLMGTLSLIWYP